MNTAAPPRPMPQASGRSTVVIVLNVVLAVVGMLFAFVALSVLRTAFNR